MLPWFSSFVHKTGHPALWRRECHKWRVQGVRERKLRHETLPFDRCGETYVGRAVVDPVAKDVDGGDHRSIGARAVAVDHIEAGVRADSALEIRGRVDGVGRRIHGQGAVDKHVGQRILLAARRPCAAGWRRVRNS